MEFRQVEAFLVTASVRNFTRAAGQLNRSQSAISQQIRSLEQEIGAPLFVRSSRQVRLSATGQALLPVAHDLLRARSLLLDQTRSAPLAVAGRLTVGTSGAATAYLWARLYREFAAAHPKVEMDIRTMPRTQDTIDHVLSGELDVGFTPLPLTRPGLDSLVLGEQTVVLAVPPTHALGRRTQTLRTELAHARFILYEPRISFRWLTDAFFRREHIVPTVVLESNDTHLIKAMVGVGFGVAFLPIWAIEREVKERRLRVVPVPGAALVQPIGAVFRNRDLSVPARAFTEFCKHHRQFLPKSVHPRSG